MSKNYVDFLIWTLHLNNYWNLAVKYVSCRRRQKFSYSSMNEYKKKKERKPFGCLLILLKKAQAFEGTTFAGTIRNALLIWQGKWYLRKVVFSSISLISSNKVFLSLFSAWTMSLRYHRSWLHLYVLQKMS